VRDDFTQQTKEIIAKQAGYLCSNPACGKPTVAALGHEGYVSIGVAAHITAASPGGPRYDPSLTREQRRHQSNGIWACRDCGTKIDADDVHFTVEMLRRWKRAAETQALLALAAPRLAPGRRVTPAVPDTFEAELERLGLTAQDYFESIALPLISAAQTDLAAFKNMPGWPLHAIALNLRISDADYKQAFNVSGLTAVIETFNEIVVIAPPGTGKTITLLQLAEAILSQDNSVAVFIPLSEWSSQMDSFFQSILRRCAFAGVQDEHLMRLAHHGRLVLILDGWNELDAVSRKHATGEIRLLQREFPDLGIIVSTRRQALDVPISGPVVEIDALSEDQQLEIVRTLRGAEGEAILDHAWRTPGIRDLVTIPLYLTALLVRTQGATLPTTKEEVLRMFVTEHERTAEKAGSLRDSLFGFHTKMLTAIAVKATTLVTTTISEIHANAVVKQVEDQLFTDGQITTPPQPTAVIDLLVSHHALVRSGAGTGVLSFQHQQFQEWYASFEVERLMRAAAAGDQEACQKLRKDVLNMPSWEEEILFACERVSRADETGLQAVAAAILETIGIDPILAAEMIYRSSAGVWDEIKEKIIAFVERWHVAGNIDRAVRFMIGTGRSEFAPQIWPLISNPNSQVHLRALRAASQFRPSVLGTDAQERLANLPDEVRIHVVSEIAGESGMDGIELATRLAQEDPSPKVQVSVIGALHFRRADRFVAEILRLAPDEVWQLLARKGYAEEIADQDAAARLYREWQSYIVSQTDSQSKLRVLLYSAPPGPDLAPQIRTLIEAVDFPARDKDALGLIYKAHENFPDEVISALIHRLEGGREIPFHAENLFQSAGITVDEGPLVELVMQPGNLQKVAEAAVRIVGPKTVGKLIDSLVAFDAKLVASGWRTDDPLHNESYRLSNWISKTCLTSFIQAILSRSETDEPHQIAILSNMLTRHGKGEFEEPIRIDGELYEQMTAAVNSWVEILLAAPVTTRAQLAEVARAIGRLAAPELLPALNRLLIEDLKRWRGAREEFNAARNRGINIPVPPDVSHSWTLQYRRAFAAIGDDNVAEMMKSYLRDPEFGFDAACVLMAIWDREHNPPKDKQFTSWPDFSEVKARRLERQEHVNDTDSSPFADAIVTVIDHLTNPDSSPEDHHQALQLAKVAFSMPFGNKAATIEALLEMPQPLRTKRELLAVLVLAGEIISADTVLDSIKTLLEEAKAKPWLLNEQHGDIDDWLELLPFSDRPDATIDGLELLEPNLKQPWRLRRLLSALGYSPSPAAEHVLNQLPQKDSRFLNQYEWFAALDKRGTESAVRILLELICEGAFDKKAGGIDNRTLGRKMAGAMETYADFRAEVYKQYERLPAGPGRTILEHAISEAVDADGLLLLVRSYAEQGKPASYLRSAIEHVAEGRRPSADWAGATEVFSVPVPELRKRLFAMTNDDTPEAKLAAGCLTIIDGLRDEYGPAESEPRHPDIDSGRTWPLEASVSAF
jgi:hypothetical protein